MPNEDKQTTNYVVMVRPDSFGFNSQTAETDVFQHDLSSDGVSYSQVRDLALREFSNMQKTLNDNGINVLVLPSRTDKITPDAVFPNNWFSHHADGTLVVYPMLTANRRDERQIEKLVELLKTSGIAVKNTLDITAEENSGGILEGTGSLVLDRVHKVAFVISSPRSDQATAEMWAKRMGYELIYLHAYDDSKRPLYHTNVVMNIGDKFAITCPESITDEGERKIFLDKLTDLGKEIITITIEQVYHFCGNVLELKNNEGESLIIVSENAYNAFTEDQKLKLSNYGKIIPIAIPTIEKVGGGGVRCMMAEVFMNA